MKNEEQLLKEVHEMRTLMSYMDGQPINESATSQGLKTATQGIKGDMSGGLDNQYEKNAVEALLSMVKNIQGEGSQLTPKVKKYIQLLSKELENGEVVNEDEIINEDIADKVIDQYDIESLVEKIVNDMKISPTLIPVLFEKIAKKLAIKRDKKLLPPNRH